MAALKSLKELPGIKPEDLAALSEADQNKLLDIINTACRVQEDEYRTATEKALSHVPGLLRGTVRKIIIGKL